MEALIVELKRDFDYEMKKNNGSAYSKALLLYRIAYSYDAITLYDSTTTYVDSIFQYLSLSLPYSRQAKDVELINVNYKSIMNLEDNLPISTQIQILKEWIIDYNEWFHTIEKKSDFFPHLLLAQIYRNIGANDEAIQSVMEMINIATLDRDKSMAHEWLAMYFHEQNNNPESVQHYYEFLRYFVPKQGSIPEAVKIIGAYTTIINYKIEIKKWDEALELIPNIDVRKHCINCDTPELEQSIGRLVFYPNLQNFYYAKAYIGKQEYEKAYGHLISVTEKSVSKISTTKVWADYYKQTGDTLKSHKFLDQYTNLVENREKNTSIRQRNQSKASFDLAKSFETSLIQEKAEQEKLLQEQKLIAIERQNELDNLKAVAANQVLLSRAEQAELEKKVEKDRLELEAAQNQKEQEYKISLLNKYIDAQERIRLWLLGGLSLFSLFAGVLFFQNKSKKRLNNLLQHRKNEIEHKHSQLEQTLSDLKSTQAQLIQSEKMASLGELTAGIAHEIQNPLNFVNNFSEVSSELLDEMNEELEKGDIDEAKFIANDIKQNLDKINHHGKRADAIVKGMLEHSRISSGEKVPTDINALAEEYLRLSYHGMRAKDKSFNADFVTDFDPTLPKINLVPQEIGRVLLNIINNAFQACVGKDLPGFVGDDKRNLEGLSPLVKVTTKNLGDKIEITISDNGPGIPDSIKSKIFQPFFTTKPTGQGTGLGLSLSYDIVKAHGGEIKVDSKFGEGTEFVINLPYV